MRESWAEVLFVWFVGLVLGCFVKMLEAPIIAVTRWL
jgi:hypothetical protein